MAIPNVAVFVLQCLVWVGSRQGKVRKPSVWRHSLNKALAQNHWNWLLSVSQLIATYCVSVFETFHILS